MTHGAPASGDLTIRCVRDKDWFEVVFRAMRRMERESTLAMFRALADAVLATK